MKVKDAQFFTVVSSFLNVYLVKNRSCSSNTVKSYEDALNLLFTFLEGTKDIPRQRVSWSHFTRQNIQEFVDWLEKVRNCSRQTQLQRLAANTVLRDVSAINGFLNFVIRKGFTAYKIPPKSMPKEVRNFRAYIFTDTEIEKMLDSADHFLYACKPGKKVPRFQ